MFNAAHRESGVKPKLIRSQGLMPANVYLPGKESIMLTVKSTDFVKLYDHVGESGLVYLEIDGKQQLPVLVQEVQIDPLSGKFLHVVFRNVSLKEKITAEVAIEFTGVFDVTNGVLVTLKETLPLEALPTEMPEKIVVDLGILTEIGQSILIKDVATFGDKVTLMLSEEDLETPIVLVQEQKVEVEEETTPETVVEGEGEAATPEVAEPEKT